MEHKEARERILQIRRIVVGHPPGDPVENLKRIAEIASTTKRRKATGGYDRQERGGTDREG